MMMPPQLAPVDRSISMAVYDPAFAGVSPQIKACTPCIRIGGRWCIRLIGRRWCVNLPYFGRWKACCWTRWGWPPVKCGIQQC